MGDKTFKRKLPGTGNTLCGIPSCCSVTFVSSRSSTRKAAARAGVNVNPSWSAHLDMCQ